jgi:hypothetical protein
MNQVHNIRDGLQGNLGAVEGAAASRSAGQKHTIAALLAI